MRISIIIIAMFITTLSFSQITVEWKGGTSGNENTWQEAKNWSNNRVPDEFTFVVIKAVNSGHNAQPVINEAINVAGIKIHQRATLTIKKSGKVTIDGTSIYTKGIVNQGGKIINNGIVKLYHIEGFSYESLLTMMSGLGDFYLDGFIVRDKP